MGSLLGSEVQPNSSAGYNWYNTAAQAGGTEGAISGALGNAGLNYGTGGASASFQGLPGYGGQLSPTNMGNLDVANQMWGQGNPGIAGLQGYGSQFGGSYFGGGQADSSFANDMGNIQQFGGMGGSPTTNMSLMAQYGGQAGPGTSAMSNLLQFGSAGPTGMNSIAQNGSVGSWGNQIGALANSPLLSGAGLMDNPYMSAAAGAQGGLGTIGGLGGSAAQALMAGNTPNMQGLQNIAGGQGAGGSVNQLPAWQAMIQAEQQPIAQGQAALQSQFDVGDNRFSTAFGQAAGNYAAQTAATQNAALTGAATQSMQQGLQNQLTASAQLGAQGYGGLSGLLGSGSGALSQLYGGGVSSAQQLAGLSGGAATQLSNLGYGANQTVNSNSLLGAQNLFAGQQAGTNALFNNQNASLGNFMNYSQGMQGLGANTANALGSQYNSYLGTGGQLGQQAYNLQHYLEHVFLV